MHLGECDRKRNECIGPGPGRAGPGVFKVSQDASAAGG